RLATSATSTGASRWSEIATHALGGLLGGLVGAAGVIVITLALKAGMDFVAAQAMWLVGTFAPVRLGIAVLVLQGIGRSETAQDRGLAASSPGRLGRARAWITFRPDAVRADITGDVVDTAGEEERFPWRLAPLRAIAVFATVGLGGPMGT